jgi:gluconokinase
VRRGKRYACYADMVLLIMGVAGSGKTTIGTALATRLEWTFLEADDDHSPENIAKMHAGIPLTDADRSSWLAHVRARIISHVENGENIVVACSALKEAYRRYLRQVPDEVVIVHLSVPPDVLADRLRNRKHHFAGVNLLESQLKTLEVPQDAIVVDASQPIEATVAAILSELAPRSRL